MDDGKSEVLVVVQAQAISLAWQPAVELFGELQQMSRQRRGKFFRPVICAHFLYSKTPGLASAIDHEADGDVTAFPGVLFIFDKSFLKKSFHRGLLPPKAAIRGVILWDVVFPAGRKMRVVQSRIRRDVAHMGGVIGGF